MSVLFSSIDVLAQPPIGQPDPSNSLGIAPVSIPGNIAVIGASLVLLALLNIVDRLLPWLAKWDNRVRVFVGIVGVAGPLATVPFIRDILAIITLIIDAIAQGAGWGLALIIGFNVISVVLLLLAIYIYYRKQGGPQLVFLVIASAAFIGLPWVQVVIAWYISWIAVPLLSGLIAAFNWAAERRISFG